MKLLPSVIPWWWKAGAALALVAALATAGAAYRSHVYQLGYDAAVDERTGRDLAAVVGRVQDNAALALKQDAINLTITEAKHEEMQPVRERIVTQRVYVGSAICGPAAAAEAEGASSGDGEDPARRVVSQRTEEDIRALELKVEGALATGRSCQAFVKSHGLAP